LAAATALTNCTSFALIEATLDPSQVRFSCNSS
jgi:hypothetical protein